MRRIEPTQQLKTRILERIEKGWTIVRLGREPGFPTQPVISKWARADAAFGTALKRAYQWRRVMRTQHLVAPSFHWDTAQAFLEKVRAGEGVKALTRTRPWPDEKRLRRWKVERPDFAAALEEAKRAARMRRLPARWRRFDRATADAVIVALARGVPAGRLAAEAGLPGKAVLRRWRRQDADFASGYAIAWRAGTSKRMKALALASRPSARKAEQVARLLGEGRSLNAIAGRADMPSASTLRRWLRVDPDFAKMVAMGREEAQERLLDEAYEVALATTEASCPASEKQVARLLRRAERMRPRPDVGG